MSALRAGVTPITADLFADSDLQSLCPADRIEHYPEGALRWLRDSGADAWMYTGAFENYPALVDAMAKVRPVLGNDGDVLRRVRDPFVLAGALRRAGLDFPETHGSAFDLPDDGAWLEKTFNGSGGSGVRRRDDDTASDAVQAARAPRIGAATYYQRHIDGDSGAAIFVGARGAARLLGITRQLTGNEWNHTGEFQYGGSIGPWNVGAASVRQIHTIGDALAAAFCLTGLFGVDFVRRNGEIWVVEVNPRFTASVEIVERFSGERAIERHLDACRRGRISAKKASRRPSNNSKSCRQFGKAIVFARADGLVTPSLAALASRGAIDQRAPSVADIPAAGAFVRQGRPVATVFAEADTESNVLEKLIAAAEALEATLRFADS